MEFKKSENIWLAMVLCLFLIAGCGQSEKPTEQAARKIQVTDSLGRNVELPYPVTKVVVSNAYNAEIINAIGAVDKIVGVDYYIYQDKKGFKNRFTQDMVVGQSQNEFNYEKIIELAPEVVILTSNGSWQEAEEKLKPFGIAVVAVDAYYTEQFEKNVGLLGKIFGVEEKAKELSDYFMTRLAYVEKRLKDVPKKRVYFEYRTQGRTTFPGDYFYWMIEYAHGDNIFKDATNKTIDPEAVIERNPSYIVKVSDSNIYSSYIPPTRDDFKQIAEEINNRLAWNEIDAVKDNTVLLLSHYAHGGGSKLVGTLYIAKFLYPEYLPELDPEEVFKDWVVRFQGLEYKPGHVYQVKDLL